MNWDQVFRDNHYVRATSGRSHEWVRTADALPPEGVVVDTKDSGGNVQQLVRESGLWFFPDRSMYVYYVPQCWRDAYVADAPPDPFRSLGHP